MTGVGDSPSFTPLLRTFEGSTAGAALIDVIESLFSEEVIDLVQVSDVYGYTLPVGDIYIGYIGSPHAIELRLPAHDFVSLSVGDLTAGFVSFKFQLIVSPTGWRLLLEDLDVSLKIKQELLRAVTPADALDPRATLRFHAGISIASDQNIQFTPFTVSLEPAYVAGTGFVVSAERVGFDLNAANPRLFFKKLSMRPPQDLFDTPIPLPDMVVRDGVIERAGFSGEVAAEWDLRFDHVSNAFHYVVLDESGQSENIAAKFFGLKGGIRRFALRFDQNVPNAVDIQGGLNVPYFDAPVDIGVEIVPRVAAADFDVDFVVKLQGVGDHDIQLKKDDLIALSINSLAVEKESNIGRVTVTGGIQPLLFASDGVQWPKLDAKDLSLEQNLADLSEPPILKFKEAWLDLESLATLDLFGFHFELNRVGLGYQETDDKLWIDLTGNVKLIDQIPVGVGVEGFRITWPRTLYQDLGLETLFQEQPSYTLTVQDAINIASKIEVKFDGVYLFYGVPQAVEFEGYIRFLKEAQKVGFAGDVILRVPASGLEIEAGLMIGINFEDPPYPFLYVYFGILLPSGIPLGQSGLALKGAKGLFGLNVTPAKTDEQNWYYDWYKRGPIEGAHPTNKWQDLRMALAIGAGITITTTDGKILGVQGLLVLAIPGPFIMIEGKALIFDGVFPGEPPLKALAVFDGRARTVQLNIEAGAELIEDVLEANGVAEAFFDFKDLTNWHLYLGEDEPEERRVHALILKLGGAYLFRADAYLMTDMIQPYTVRSRLGVFIGFQPPIPSLGPVQITIDALITGVGELQIRAGNLVDAAVSDSLSTQSVVDNVNFSGQLALDANLEITAFGFGLRAAAHAAVMGEGPKPFEVKGKIAISVEVPLPLEAVESIPIVDSFLEFVEQAIDVPEIEPIEIEIEFVFRPDDFAVPDLVSPLRERTMSMESHFVQEAEAIEWRTGLANGAESNDLAHASPEVEMDHRPVLIFDQEMNVTDDDSVMASPIAAHPAGLKEFHQGMVTFTPTLNRIALFEHRKSEKWVVDGGAPDPENLGANWTKIADTAIASPIAGQAAQPFFGIWRADADPENPGQAPRRTLRLWSTMPFGPAIGPAFYEAIFGHPNQVDAATAAHDEFFVGGASKARITCVDFERVAKSRFRQSDAQQSKYDRIPIDNPLTVEDVALSGEFGLFVQTKSEKPCLISPGNLRIEFAQRVRWVEITFCEKIPDIIIAESPVFRRHENKGRSAPARVEGKHRSVQIKRHPSDSRTLEITSDQAFDRISIMRQASCVCKVCYKAHKDMQDEETDAGQLHVNDQLVTSNYFAFQPVLKPGRHYRIVVQSDVAATPNPDRNPFPDGSFLHSQAETLATNIVNEILGASSGVRSFVDEAYFQTDGPPNNLQRFIKWTTPALNEKRFFGGNDFMVRFKRPYIKELFADDEFALDAYVRSSNGVLISEWDTNWMKSQSSTLTPDEHAWLDYLQSEPQNEPLIQSVPKDDILRIARPQIIKPGAASATGWTLYDLDSQLAGNWDTVIDSRYGIPMQVMRQTHQTRTIAVAKDSNSGEFHFTTMLYSNQRGGLGVVFRFVDPQNYFRFTLDDESSRQSLVKMIDGEPDEILAKDGGFDTSRLNRLSITATHEIPSTTHFEITVNGELWGEFSDNDPTFAVGAVGLYAAGNNDANFVNPRLTKRGPLNSQSRYELIIAGGNAGEMVFGDSYAESLLLQSFGTSGWSLGSGSAWRIDADDRKITKTNVQLNDPLILDSPPLNDVDIRAHVTGLGDAGMVGFIVRAARQTEANSQEAQQYRVIVSKTGGKFGLCVCRRSATGSEQKICNELVSSTPHSEDGFDFRVNVFATSMKVFLFHRLIKELSLTEFDSAKPLLLEGRPGILATAGVSFQQLQIRRSELSRIPFMTSRFHSYGEMIDSGRRRITELVAHPAGITSSALDAVADLKNKFVYQRFRQETGAVDFRDGSMNRETWEGVRQDYREAKALLDESFAEMCNSLTGIYYNPPSDYLVPYLLHSDDGVCGVYVCSPETLDLKAEVDTGLLNDADGTSDLNAWQQVGSTEIHLLKDGQLYDNPTYVLSNGDGNNLLILLKPFDPVGGHFESGAYALRFVHTRNPHDDSSDIDHRYDRPVQSCLGFDVPDVADLYWTVD